MTVKELQMALQGLPSNAQVVVYEKDANTGCDTCGYGGTLTEKVVTGVSALEGTGTVELVL